MKYIYNEKRLYVENELAPALRATGRVRSVEYNANDNHETVTVTLNGGYTIPVNVTCDSKWAIYKDVARRILEMDL